jgi:hypothetical protein
MVDDGLPRLLNVTVISSGAVCWETRHPAFGAVLTSVSARLVHEITMEPPAEL